MVDLATLSDHTPLNDDVTEVLAQVEDAKESKRFFDKISARRTLIQEQKVKRGRALIVEGVEANKKNRIDMLIGCIMSEKAVLGSSIASKVRNQQAEVMNEVVEVMRMQGRKKFVLRPLEEVIANAKSIFEYTMNGPLKDKGPQTVLEFYARRRIVSLTYEAIVMIYHFVKETMVVDGTIELQPAQSPQSNKPGVYALELPDRGKVGMSERKIRVRVGEQIPDNVSGAFVIMNDDKIKEMLLSNPNILVRVERMREFMAIGQCLGDFREQMQLKVVRSCVEVTFMAGLIIKNLDPTSSIGNEIPLTFGSECLQQLYSRDVTTPSTRAIGILKVNEGDKCLFICDNTWETLPSKVLRMLNGSDLETKALVLATTKRYSGEFLKRWVQSFMLGDQESIAKNAVTSCSTYDALVDICEEIKVVLDSELPIEVKSDRIFRELSTFISEYDDPYNSTRPNDDLWTKETGRHVRAMIVSDRKTLSESPETKIVHFMECQFLLHIPEKERKKFDSNPHEFVAQLHQIEVGVGLYTNVIVLGCSYFTPFALESNSRPTTRIRNSACLAAVTNVLAHAGIVEQEVSDKVNALFRSFGIVIEGHGTVDRPEGSVPAACHQTIPEEFCTNPWNGGAKEIANILMRKDGDTYTLTPVGNRLHLQYTAAILQIMGNAYLRKWLHDIHGISLGDDPESFLESMQLQGVTNAHKRYRKQGIKIRLTPTTAAAASVTATASTRKRKHHQPCGFEGWCVNKISAHRGANHCCSLHFIDDSSGEPLAKLQSERYTEVCDPEVRLYNEEREESIVFRNIFAVREWCATHKFGQRSNEKGIVHQTQFIIQSRCKGRWTRSIIEEDIKDAGPNGLLVERSKGLPQGYDGKWIWTLTGRLTHTTPSSVTYFERDQNGNYQYVETIYDYQVGRIARLKSSK